MAASYAQTENDDDYFSSVTTSSSSSAPSSSCIIYNPEEKVITISCKAATLTDIYNELKDPDILNRAN
jgi:hypothetical protein